MKPILIHNLGRMEYMVKIKQYINCMIDIFGARIFIAAHRNGPMDPSQQQGGSH
jgi:hypothetical protein